MQYLYFKNCILGKCFHGNEKSGNLKLSMKIFNLTIRVFVWLLVRSFQGDCVTINTVVPLLLLQLDLSKLNLLVTCFCVRNRQVFSLYRFN